ncbi:MAG: class 1 fructose-bisphosphatase [Sulfitobacter sp.]
MKQTTLRRHLTSSGLDPNLIFLIEDISSACRSIAHLVRNGAFNGHLGATSETNVQGETQKTLDIMANDQFERTCANSPRLAALVSEEVEEVTWLKEPEAGDYLLYFDPLDGSSNLDVNLSVGSIFAIMQVQADGDRSVQLEGRKQLCAGYALYGPSTMFVLTDGDEVTGFTCHNGTGDFRVTHPNMKVPSETSEFAINTSRYRYWDEPVRRYVDECVAGKEGVRGRSFNMRWTASMVAEIHRILTRGGVFLYPADSNNRAAGGKLRLMYEANPMAMIIERAGGGASTGYDPILDIKPTGPHQRVPVILGSNAEVDRLIAYHTDA